MPTFVLKKYTPEPTITEQASVDETNPNANQQAQQVEKEAATIEVNASDSIAKIVAQALYKALPNIEIVQKEESEKKDNDNAAKVVSTEEINLSPVDALHSLGASKCVLILNNGFKTAQEEWFLQTLEQRGVKAFFTISGFVRHVQSTIFNQRSATA
jgi:hypothetical protein